MTSRAVFHRLVWRAVRVDVSSRGCLQQICVNAMLVREEGGLLKKERRREGEKERRREGEKERRREGEKERRREGEKKCTCRSLT
jgi:hypothetical protein